MAPVKLVSSDNEEFEVEKDVATRSVLVKNMLEGNAHSSHLSLYPSSTLWIVLDCYVLASGTRGGTRTRSSEFE